jgi:hypothetical protein
MESSISRNLNEVDDKVQYYVNISNRFAALENLDAEEDIDRASKLLQRTSKFQPQSRLL